MSDFDFYLAVFIVALLMDPARIWKEGAEIGRSCARAGRMARERFLGQASRIRRGPLVFSDASELCVRNFPGNVSVVTWGRSDMEVTLDGLETSSDAVVISVIGVVLTVDGSQLDGSRRGDMAVAIRIPPGTNVLAINVSGETIMSGSIGSVRIVSRQP